MHPQFRRSMVRMALAAAATLSLVACTVGPDYRKPAVEVPGSFKETPDAGRWKVASPGDRADRGKWWEVFNDPDLNALEEQVAVSNLDLAVAESRFQEARAYAQAVRAGSMPTVTAGASVARFRRSENAFNSSSRDAGPSNNFLLPLDVSWEADIWGRVRRSIESSEAGAQALAADRENVRLSLQSELAVDYFLLRSLDRERQLLDSTIESYRKALELTNYRYQGGVASQADVAQAQTQFKTTQAQAVDVGVQRALLEHAMAVLVGKAPSQFSVAPAPFNPVLPEMPVGLPSELLERRPDVAAAERTVASANAQIGIAEAAFYPTLTLGATGGFEAATAADWFAWPSRFWAIGTTASMTLFDAGRRKALTAQAQSAYDGTVAAYRRTVLGAFQDVEDNLATLRILADEAQLQDEAVKSSRRSVALTTNRYEAGAVSYLDVVIAQSLALNAERASVDIARRRTVASVRLIKALGGDWKASDLPASADLVAEKTPARSKPAR
jgi:NodT family efflux transporter outer membrane factor (OMF) lipoprotein